MKPWKPALLAISMVALARIVACDSTATAETPDRLITEAEAGSEAALAKLEALSEAKALAEHADLIGAAAARISQEAPKADFPEGFVSRWHRLFLATDPLQNASARTRQEFAGSLFLIEPIMPDEVIAGREYSVGRRMVGTLRHDELDALNGYSVVESLESVVANGKEHWPPERGSIATRPLAFAKGGASGSSFKTVLLDADQAPALEGQFEVTIVVDVSVTDDSTHPPTVFAEWTEELTATPKVKRVFASWPIEPRPGEADIETVLALIAQFEAGDEEAARKLVELGKSGELRPHADELGSLLAEALRDDWQPRIAAHFAEHGWEPERPGAHLPPTPNELSSLLIGLFYLAEPVSTATRETWLDVATAGVYAHHRLTLESGEQQRARLQIRTFTALVQTLSLDQVSGMGIKTETVEFDGSSWPLLMESSQRVTSTTLPTPHWRNYLAAEVRQQNYAHGLREDFAARVFERQGRTINDLRTHVELRLLHDDEITLATWPLTIDTPITLDPLDEPAPDRR